MISGLFIKFNMRLMTGRLNVGDRTMEFSEIILITIYGRHQFPGFIEGVKGRYRWLFALRGLTCS
ncbi:hypothetical protein CS542_09890 [Pedobacter sp. IW39]|nr:hypothetical protein CS542_09890 [Pedobacter sp. IW39]